MDWDCIVAGGGAAGLSAALTLGRARKRTLVVDAGGQSNLASDGIGGLLGHDRRAPAELYALGRAEVARYGVTVVDGSVASVAPGFRVALSSGEEHATRALILATGMDYGPVALPGVAELFGRSVFHCPFCHGWEHRDQPLGVLTDGPQGVHAALLLRNWTDDVVLVSSQPLELDDEARGALSAAGVTVEQRTAVAIRPAGAELGDGGFLSRAGFLVSIAPSRHAALAVGAELDDGGVPVVDGFGRTSVPGLFAIGDLSAPMPSITAAIADGSRAAAAVVFDQLTQAATSVAEQ